jgi:choline dehydrogenase-like flavoprotein
MAGAAFADATIQDLVVEDQAPVTLTHIQGGSRGPVLLVHGLAVSSHMFALPTQRLSFVDYLCARGFDVWLVDWRGSTQHPLRQFTLDEAARYDIPAAVHEVRDTTGADSIQVVAHCAGSIVLFMSMSLGLVPEVRSVVASQVALHVDVPWASRLKARVGLATRLAQLGMTRMSPADDDGHPAFQWAFGKMTDTLHHECTTTFCHRLTFIYGHLYHHARLDEGTHDRLAAQFGGCNMLALRHVSQLVTRGHSQAFDYGPRENQERYGSASPPSYLNPQHFAVPITLLSGQLNKTWLPSSTERTYDWLVEAHGPGRYSRRVIPGYGHLDTFMGTDAATDAFPLVLEGLERS